MEKFSEQTFWSPSIFSIDDFIIALSGKVVTNDITLLFELYKVYLTTYLPGPKDYEREELPTFDHFYAWGQVLLKDFDEVDRYLVDVDLLYRNLEELGDIEGAFGQNEEMLDALKHFNQVMGQEEKTKLMLHFSNQWSRVCKAYHGFKKHLVESKMAYSGMLYRDVVEKLEADDLKIPFKKIVFSGFNALSTSVERLLDLLLEGNIAEIFWDADKSYLGNEQQPAGRFLRTYRRRWRHPDVHWIISDWVKGRKKIQAIGAAQSMAQAKITGTLIDHQLEQGVVNEKTAVVLADENLLFPVLYALPKAIEELNVTMGYPLRNTSLFTLSECWIRLQISGRGQELKRFLNGEDLFAFLSHPLIQSLAPKQCQRMKVLLRRIKQPWISVATLLEKITHPDLVGAFSASETTDHLLERLLAFLVKVHQNHDGSEVVQQEFSYHYIKHLTQFKEQLRHHHLNITGATLLRLMRDTFTSAKVAFSGEPLTGLQIMGFLETRSLDFEHLYILSVNEKKLPAGKRSNSYIPFALRKIFKLPTFEELDAIYAYHFHRVIQRANTVTLLYDTEVAVDGSGEKSRFIRQLEYYIKEERGTDSNISWNESIYNLPLTDHQDPVGLSIQKTPEVLQGMNRFRVLPDQETKGLAPTSLTTYIECSLRFYFQYVAQLPERRVYSQDMEPRDFGNLTHRALELIYAPYLSKTITVATIEQLIRPEHLENLVKEAFQSYYKLESMPLLEGRNLLQERIIQRLVLKVLEYDKTEAPFTIVGLEEELQQKVMLDQYPVALRGSLDRVQKSGEEANEMLKIIDYKTGRLELVRNRPSQANPWPLDDYINKYFTDSRYKSGFQSYFYAYIWRQSHPKDSIMAGIFGLKKSSEGVQWLQQGREIPETVLTKFGTYLRGLVAEIFDPKIPFSQTDDLKKCVYCPYREICQR